MPTALVQTSALLASVSHLKPFRGLHSCSLRDASCPRISICGIGSPDHGYSARAVPKNGGDHLVALNVGCGLLPPREPVAIHLVCIPNHEAGPCLLTSCH